MDYTNKSTGVIAMGSETVRKCKKFFAWQDHEEEAWLRQMAQQGYHLSSLVFPMVYEFTIGEPRDIVYRLDYTDVRKNEIDSYLQLFQDAGWEYFDSFVGWYYFRKTADSESTNEIYTDVESKVQKYQRLLTILIIFPILLAGSLTGAFREPSIPVLNVLLFFLFAFWIYVIWNIYRRIRQLKRL